MPPHTVAFCAWHNKGWTAKAGDDEWSEIQYSEEVKTMMSQEEKIGLAGQRKKASQERPIRKRKIAAGQKGKKKPIRETKIAAMKAMKA